MSAVVTATAFDARRGAASAPLAWLRERGMGASILVAAISSAFGVLLISATGLHRRDAARRPVHRRQRHARVRAQLPHRAAGRRRRLRRGDRDGQHVLDRRRRPHPTHRAAAPDRSLGTLAACGGRATGTRRRGDRRVRWGSSAARRSPRAGSGWPAGCWGSATSPFTLVQPVLLIPAAIVALTTWAAAWAGSRRVLTVTPLQALGGSVEASHDAGRASHRPQRRRDRAVRRGRRRCWPPASRSGWSRRSASSWRSSAASCRSPDSRSARRS